MDSIVLRKNEIYNQIKVVSKKPLKDKLDLNYKRFKYQNYKFVLRETVYKEFENKNLVELTLGWNKNKLVYFGSITKELDFLCEEHDSHINIIKNSIESNSATYNSIAFQTGKQFKK